MERYLESTGNQAIYTYRTVELPKPIQLHGDYRPVLNLKHGIKLHPVLLHI